MKAVDKSNKLAQEERERARRKKRESYPLDGNNPIYTSKYSHKKTNKK